MSTEGKTIEVIEEMKELKTAFYKALNGQTSENVRTYFGVLKFKKIENIKNTIMVTIIKPEE